MSNRMVRLALVGALAGALAAPALAQDPGGFGGQRRGGRGDFGGFQRGQRGPGAGQFGQGGFGMRMGQEKNPLVTHVFELINRPDVQNEIGMDLRQKNALAQYQTQMQANIRQQMQEMFRNLRGQDGAGGRQRQRDPGNAGGGAEQPGQGGQTGQQDPGQQRDQFRQQIEQQRNQIQGGMEKGLKDLLRPEQVARLYQLDLQWRGVLSIADVKVAEEIEASQQTRAAITGLVTEYQNRVRESRQQMMQAFREQRQAATNNPNQGGIRQDPMIAVERADAAARKEAEEKALKALSPEERAGWTKVQGKPFTFRSDIRTPQRTGRVF
jgi:hypothetical protein